MVRFVLSLLLMTGIIVSCSTNALTGKSQFTLLPESQLQSMASQEYVQFLSSNKVVAASANKDAEMVRRVGQRITSAVESYYREKGIADSLATAEKIKAEMALLKSENEALLVKAREERAIMTLKQHDLINKFTHKFFRKSIDNDFHINKHSTP